MRTFAVLVATIVALFCLAPAQIVMKPKGEGGQRMVMKSLKVTAVVEGQVASTEMEVVFRNPFKSRVEAEFIYSLRPDMIATYFAYFYGEEKVIARVVEKERAKQIYEHITSRMRDPALIEMIGKRTFRAKIFPVMPGDDLKVEMHFVQSLKSSGSGYVLEVPIKVDKGDALDSIDVDVQVKPGGEDLKVTNNYGLTGSDPMHIEMKGTQVRPAKDLRIQVNRTPKPLLASWYAAHSGGPSGFFALTLTPNRGMVAPRLRLSGARVYDVSGTPRRLRAGQSVLITGRYAGSGKGTVTFSDSSGSLSAPVDFSDEASPNNAATKLWAARQIERSGSRKAILALSHRYCMPSKFSSWLAIPEEERKRYKEELVTAELVAEAQKIGQFGLRAGLRSEAFKSRVREFESEIRSKGLDPASIKSEGFQEVVSKRAQTMGDEIGHGRLTSEAYRNAKADIEALEGRQITTHDYLIQNAIYQALDKTSNAVARDVANGVENDGTRSHRKFLEQLAKAGERGVTEVLKGAFEQRQDEIASQIAKLDYDGKKSSPAYARAWSALRRLHRAGGGDPNKAVQQARLDFGDDEANRYCEEIATALSTSRYNTPKFKELLADLAKLGRRYKIDTSPGDSYPVQAVLSRKAWNYAEAVEQQGGDSEAARAQRDDLQRMARAVKAKTSELVQSALQEAERTLAHDIQKEETRAERNRPKLAGLWKRMRHLTAESKDDADTVVNREDLQWYYVSGSKRALILKEMRKSNPDRSKIAQLRKELEQSDAKEKNAEWAADRGERLLAELELDRLNGMKLTPEIAKQQKALREKRDQLKARMGDPLVTSDAPADSRQVVALMPDGKILPLSYEQALGRWQARFDIPPGTAIGAYKVQVIAVLQDGRRLVRSFSYEVDTTAPKAKARLWIRDGRLVMDVSGDEDIARVEALLPDGRRVSLKRNGDRYEAAVDRLESGSEVTFIVLDRAHNRTVLRARTP